jgi:hypothetical protein
MIVSLSARDQGRGAHVLAGLLPCQMASPAVAGGSFFLKKKRGFPPISIKETKLSSTGKTRKGKRK